MRGQAKIAHSARPGRLSRSADSGDRGLRNSTTIRYRPLCRACRERIAAEGDATPIAWLGRDQRYVEKLATPDVTIADMIGDVDPIKAARGGRNLSDELTIHYGLLPRANRGIFAINELPDLAGKIQVGLFNIMQEGDIQIKGYPVRLALDVLLVFTANPGGLHGARQNHYAAQGPHRLGNSHALSGDASRKAWPSRRRKRGRSATASARMEVPEYIREVVEEIAFQAREDKRVDKRSGVSQRLPISTLENVLSSAEQRAVRNRDSAVVARVADVYAAIPSMTGKFELEYEGELRGADNIARELIRAAVGKTFTKYFTNVEFSARRAVVRDRRRTETPRERFERRSCWRSSRRFKASSITWRRWASASKDDAAIAASAAEFILEGLWAHKRISRSEERGFLRRSAQDARAARSARAVGRACRGASSISVERSWQAIRAR